MSIIRVGVLRGGPSSEYEVSLKTGAAILRNMPDGHRAVDVFVDKKGVWHIAGVAAEPHHVRDHVDVMVNAMHGEYGEDGAVQAELEQLHIPYTGSSAVASAVAFHKGHAKDVFRRHGIKTPYHEHVRRGEDPEERARSIFRSLPPPYVVKPTRAGSSVGVSIVATLPKLAAALRAVLEQFDEALVEEYIRGREATCGIIEDFRGEPLYALPPVEIIPPAHKGFFDYEAKYGGETQELVPGKFSDDERETLHTAARDMHRALGLRHYSRSDFIVSRRGVFALETNTLPGLTEQSLLPKSLAAVGCTLGEFVRHLVERARAR